MNPTVIFLWVYNLNLKKMRHETSFLEADKQLNADFKLFLTNILDVRVLCVQKAEEFRAPGVLVLFKTIIPNYVLQTNSKAMKASRSSSFSFLCVWLGVVQMERNSRLTQLLTATHNKQLPSNHSGYTAILFLVVILTLPLFPSLIIICF